MNLHHITLHDNSFEATIYMVGAELVSFKNPEGQEYIWTGESLIWARHAPVLFPIVGKLGETGYLWKGQSYHLPQHGFARDLPHYLVEASANQARLVLGHNENTHKGFPFGFSLETYYQLNGPKLQITWTVRTHEPELYFSLGAHPGFLLPLDSEPLSHFYLEFEQEESALRHLLQGGLRNGTKTFPWQGSPSQIRLSDNLFSQDALVFQGIKSKYLTLRNISGTYKVKVDLAGAPWLGLWGKPGAPFVCIEPWFGVADSINATGLLQEKEAIQRIEKGQKFVFDWSISLQ